MSTNQTKLHQMICAVLIVLLQNGCASLTADADAHADEKTSIAQTAANSAASSFSNSGNKPIENKWWQAFNDFQLNEWVDKGLADNPSLLAIRSRLKQSEQAITQQQAQQLPNLNFSSNHSRRFSNQAPVSSHSLGLNSSWEIDLWGRLDSLSARKEWQHLAATANVHLRANLVAANIASAWYGWMNNYQTGQLLMQQHRQIVLALTIIKRRVALGSNSATDLWQQQRLLESINSELIKNQAKTRNFKHQLALWTATSTDELPAEPQGTLPILSDLPDIGLPLNTLAQRPDVQLALANVKASDAYLAAAISEQFPRLTLKASIDGRDSRLSDLFDNVISNIAASVFMPLIDHGVKKSVVSQRQAMWQEQQHQYFQSWHKAIFEVENILTNERQYHQLYISTNSQLTLAKQVHHFKELAYFSGNSPYLQLLSAQEKTLKLERQVLNIALSKIHTRINLYRSISHGDFVSTDSVSDKKVAF